MNIFVSYASDDRELAEQVAHSIRSRGHKVFFDRTDLPPGESYEQQIEQAISRCSVMVFLIGPESVAAGRFTRTELRLAQERWASANNHVLPVMIRPTPLDDIPGYLRSVTILEPEGNIPAEVAAATDRMARSWTRRLKSLAIAAVLVTVAIGAWSYWSPPSPAFTVEATVPRAFQRGFFGQPNLYNIAVRAANTGDIAGRVVDVSFEVEPADALLVHGGGSGVEAGEPARDDFSDF